MSRYKYEPRTTKQREPIMDSAEKAKMVRRCVKAYLDPEVLVCDWQARFPGHIQTEALLEIPPSMRRRGTT